MSLLYLYTLLWARLFVLIAYVVCALLDFITHDLLHCRNFRWERVLCVFRLLRKINRHRYKLRQIHMQYRDFSWSMKKTISFFTSHVRISAFDFFGTTHVISTRLIRERRANCSLTCCQFSFFGKKTFRYFG
jgi:hypothetical protein